MAAAAERSSLAAQLLSPRLQMVGLPLVGLTLIMFFLFQGAVLFPDQWDQWQTITLLYAMMVIASLVRSFQQPAMPAWKVFMWFGLFLGGGLALFAFTLGGFSYTTGFPVGDAVPVILFQIFIIAYSEETFFRGFMLSTGPGPYGIGVLPAAILFSVFHLAAYSVGGELNFVAFGVAFAMGMALGLIYVVTNKFGGIGPVWGLHAAWNLALLFF